MLDAEVRYGFAAKKQQARSPLYLAANMRIPTEGKSFCSRPMDFIRNILYMRAAKKRIFGRCLDLERYKRRRMNGINNYLWIPHLFFMQYLRY